MVGYHHHRFIPKGNWWTVWAGLSWLLGSGNGVLRLKVRLIPRMAKCIQFEDLGKNRRTPIEQIDRIFTAVNGFSCVVCCASDW